MELGISSWTLPWAVGLPGYPAPRWPLSPLDLVAKAASLDVGVLQIADNLPLDRLSIDEQLDLGACARSSRIRLEVGTRGIDTEHLRRYVAICTRVGASKLRTLSHTASSKPSIEEAARLIRRVLPEFEAAGVAIALENNEAHSAREYSWLVRRFATPTLGICMDTANSLGRPETLDLVVAELAEHAIVVHIKDYDVRRINTRMGFEVIGTPAGDGKVDFNLVFTALRRHGRSPSIILEHWPPFTETIERTIALEEEWLHRSLAYLRPWVNGPNQY